MATLLVACGSPDPPAGERPPAATAEPASPAAAADTAPAPATPPLLVALDGEGLRLVEAATGRTRLLPFGAPASRVEEVLTGIWGPWRERSRLPDCGAEPPTLLGWSNGLAVLLEHGAFAGWSAARPRADGAPLPAVQGMAGLGVGAGRREVEEAYAIRVRETTLGTEFEAGGIHGVFADASPGAEVIALWAGRACLFR